MARNCKRNNDCPQGKKCVNGTCSDQSSNPPQTQGSTPSNRQCTYDSDCGAWGSGAKCIQGACVTSFSSGQPDPTGAIGAANQYYQTNPGSPGGSGGSGGGSGGGPSGPPPNMADNCKYVCGDAAIAAEHARIDAKLAQSQADQAQFQTAQGQWQTTLAGQNAAIAAHLPHYQPPRAPSQPGGYSPGQYQTTTMPAGGTTQAPPSGNQTPAPTPAPTPTPTPGPGQHAGNWLGALSGQPGQMSGALGGQQATPANGTTPALVSPYAPGTGFTSWQDYLKQSGRG